MRDPELPPRLSWIARTVAASSRRAAVIVAVATLLCAWALVYTGRHFAITTDALDLTSPHVPWRRDQAIFKKAFPQQSDLIVAVVDGATPELAERAASELAAVLSQQTKLFQSVQRPDASTFFRHNGLLLLPLGDVKAAAGRLIAAQAFLAPLAADPTLRGVMASLGVELEGVRQGQAKLEDLGRLLTGLGDCLGRVAERKAAFFSWRSLMSGDTTTRRETRRLVLFQPKLDNTTLLPGAEASKAIHDAARNLLLDPANGVRVRLTGSVMLANQEFATLTERAGLMTAAMMLAMLLMLGLAVRSPRVIVCILVTTAAGLVLTAAIGLMAVRRFNLISVAFIPLFVGLGIDFAIQFSVRYRAERLAHPRTEDAVVAAGSTIGGSLAVAAAAIALGFFAFLPTDYLGASELGLIAGIGMVIAFLLSVTLLPALLVLVGSKGQAPPGGLSGLAWLEAYLLAYRKPVLVIAGSAAAISLVLVPFVSFDFNPLHLRNATTESVSTLLDLMTDPDRTPNTIDVLAPSLAGADALARRLSPLPEVDHTLTLSSFVPDDQQAKLAVIGDAATLLDLVLHPIDSLPPPSDAQTARSLAETAKKLREVAGEKEAGAAADARRLAMILEKLATGPDSLRKAASDAVIVPLSITLEQLREAFRAEAVTLQTLPPDLVRDWVSPDGTARILVFPTGDSNDNRVLVRFADSVKAVAPDATGAPIVIQAAARTIVGAFIQAGILSLAAITLLLMLVLGRVTDVIRTLLPVLLAGALTLATCVLIGQPINFANIIALPLLFGIGVAFNIYFVMAWRSGEKSLLRSSLSRGILFSALTTGAAFGNLLLSSHPGTASMGKLLTISMAWTLVAVLVFAPALLGPPRVWSQTRSPPAG